MNQPETVDTIRHWAVDTFGQAEAPRIYERAQEEWDELVNELYMPTILYDKALEEAADVVITLANLPGLQAAINAKMAKNRARQWKVMGDGTGYHIKEPTA